MPQEQVYTKNTLFSLFLRKQRDNTSSRGRRDAFSVAANRRTVVEWTRAAADAAASTPWKPAASTKANSSSLRVSHSASPVWIHSALRRAPKQKAHTWVAQKHSAWMWRREAKQRCERIQQTRNISGQSSSEFCEGFSCLQQKKKKGFQFSASLYFSVYRSQWYTRHFVIKFQGRDFHLTKIIHRAWLWRTHNSSILPWKEAGWQERRDADFSGLDGGERNERRKKLGLHHAIVSLFSLLDWTRRLSSSLTCSILPRSLPLLVWKETTGNLELL